MIKKLCLTATFAICIAAPASADTYTVNNAFAASGVPSFSFSVAGGPNNGAYSNGYAGPLWLDTAEGSAAGGKDLLVYCVDLNHYDTTGLPKTYSTGNLTAVSGLPVGTTDPLTSPVQQTSNLIGRIAADGLLNYGVDNYKAAAAQLAIWHLAYPGVAITIGDATVLADYNAYIGLSGNPTGNYAKGLTPDAPWPNAGNPQAYVMGLASSNTPPVPELSTWGMMILGFVGIGFIAYRRRSGDVSLRLA